MVATAWKTVRSAEPDRLYVASLTRVPLARLRARRGALAYTRRIEEALQRTAGLLGYSFRIQPRCGTVWSLSAWESPRALVDFTYGGVHAGLAAVLRPDVSGFGHAVWDVPGRALPLSWSDAIVRALQPAERVQSA